MIVMTAVMSCSCSSSMDSTGASEIHEATTNQVLQCAGSDPSHEASHLAQCAVRSSVGAVANKRCVAVQAPQDTYKERSAA